MTKSPAKAAQTCLRIFEFVVLMRDEASNFKTEKFKTSIIKKFTVWRAIKFSVKKIRAQPLEQGNFSQLFLSIEPKIVDLVG